jgi:EpsI family protein
MASWADPPVHVIAPWQVATSRDLSWEPERQGPETKFNQSYQYAADRVDLSWAQYSGRRAMDFGTPPDGTENPQSILTDEGFERARINGRYIQVSRSLMESARNSRRIWTWYYVGGEYTASRGRVRFLQAKARLCGEPASVTVIRLGTDNRTNAGDMERALQDFLLHTSFLTAAGSSTVSLSTLIY